MKLEHIENKFHKMINYNNMNFLIVETIEINIKETKKL
jgi:hypothetical protein